MKEIIKNNKKYFLNENKEVIKIVTINNNPSKTQRQFTDECNINNIIKKFKKTGQVTHIRSNAQKGVYADLSQLPTDYMDALSTLSVAQDAFMTLPALIRKKFDNDPSKLIAFLEDPKNDTEAINLGLKELPKKSENEQIIDELKNLNKKNDDKKTTQTNSNS